MVPRAFSHPCIVKQPTPYCVPPAQHQGTHARSGSLEIGRVVWTRKTVAEYLDDGRAPVDAYIEGVGQVELHPDALKTLF